MNKYFSIIYFIFIVILILFGSYIISVGLNVKNDFYMMIDLIVSMFFIGGGGFLSIWGLIHKKNFRLIENQSNANIRNHFLVIHPYKSRFSLKSLMNVLEFIKYFRQ